VIAPRFSGKTVFAKQLKEAIEEEEPSWRVELVCFEQAKTVAEAWQQVEATLAADQPSQCWVDDGRPIADRLAALVEASPFTVQCLLLDGLDELPDEVLRLIATELRTFKNSGDYREAATRVRCVLFGATKLRFLTCDRYSPLNNMIEELDLPDLTDDEGCRVFAELMGKPELAEDVSAALAEATAGHVYLLDFLAKRLADVPGAVGVAEIRSAARRWSDAVTVRNAKPDACLHEAIEYVERDRRAFEVVLQLLDQNDKPVLARGTYDPAAMCGAVAMHDGALRLRGKMFENAFRRYFDDVRKADYHCLHGDWEEALACYRTAGPDAVRARRQVGVGLGRRHILDLYLGLSACSTQFHSLSDAEQFAAETALCMFGADAVRLWRQDPDDDARMVYSHAWEGGAASSQADVQRMAATAIAYATCVTLDRNQGIVQAIGRDASRPRWALELHYEQGLPGEWVHESLRYVEASLHTLVDEARRREAVATHQRAQRRLIHRIALSLQKATAVQEVLSLIIDGVQRDLAYECAQLSLVYREEGKIRAVKSNGVYEQIQTMTVRDLDGPDVLAVVIREGKPRRVDDCSALDSNCDRVAINAAGLKSQVIVPLLLDEQSAIGALQVGNTTRTGAFKDADAELLQMVADTAAIALRMAGEREAFDLAMQVSGDAMVMVDATHRITLCNEAYRDLFGVRPSDPAPLTPVAGGDGAGPLVKSAHDRGRPLQTFRDLDGRRCIVTAAGQADAFGRYAGGLEVIATRNPLYGLTDAMGEMLAMASEEKLGQAVVDCVCRRLGYSRARLYRLSPDGQTLVSRWSAGMASDVAARFHDQQMSMPRDTSPKSFLCLASNTPVIVVRQECAEEGLPAGEMTLDSQHRRVLIMPTSEVLYADELGKSAMAEWLDVPLKVGEIPFGKLSIDGRPGQERFWHEDLELMALFSSWAAAVMGRVVELETARQEASLGRQIRALGGREGMEAVGWHLLVRLTLEGPLAFNRAAILLRDPQTNHVRGFLCHGAANGQQWADEGADVKPDVERAAFINEVVNARLRGDHSDDERRRLQRFADWVVSHRSSLHRLTTGSDGATFLHSLRPSVDLRDFYDCLGWEPAQEALVAPLVFLGECEGLVYVDRAFTTHSISPSDEGLVDTVAVQLAVTANARRVAAQLRSQVMALAHAGITPFAAIHGLAEALRGTAIEQREQHSLDLIVAEARRGENLVRRLKRLADPEHGTQPHPVPLDLGLLLRDQTAPYRVLLAAKGISTAVDIEAGVPKIEADPSLLGIALAELSSNAVSALMTPGLPKSERRFLCGCRIDAVKGECLVWFSNSSTPAAPGVRSQWFEPSVSGTGSTGLGLWLVREIVAAHHGSVQAREIEGSQFEVTIRLPLPAEYHEGAA
jgi:GAF domain-containing protein